jgi:vesicle coat complex subunit
MAVQPLGASTLSLPATSSVGAIGDMSKLNEIARANGIPQQAVRQFASDMLQSKIGQASSIGSERRYAAGFTRSEVNDIRSEFARKTGTTVYTADAGTNSVFSEFSKKYNLNADQQGKLKDAMQTIDKQNLNAYLESQVNESGGSDPFTRRNVKAMTSFAAENFTTHLQLISEAVQTRAVNTAPESPLF